MLYAGIVLIITCGIIAGLLVMNKKQRCNRCESGVMVITGSDADYDFIRCMDCGFSDKRIKDLGR